jgi:hypothetical protein
MAVASCARVSATACAVIVSFAIPTSLCRFHVSFSSQRRLFEDPVQRGAGDAQRGSDLVKRGPDGALGRRALLAVGGDVCQGSDSTALTLSGFEVELCQHLLNRRQRTGRARI